MVRGKRKGGGGWGCDGVVGEGRSRAWFHFNEYRNWNKMVNDNGERKREFGRARAAAGWYKVMGVANRLGIGHNEALV